MELKTLNFLKVLIPGLIILAGFIPVKNQLDYQNYLLISGNFILSIIALLLGAIYFQINLRWIILVFSLGHINKNIFIKIINMGRAEDKTKIKALWKKKECRAFIINNIFYKNIDIDETLKQKKFNFYFNEIFWTSSVDATIISFIYFLLYYNNIWIFGNVNGIAVYFLVFSVLSLFLHIVSSFRHFSLSNEQLKYLNTEYKNAISEKVEKYFDDNEM